jgi:hypothetical protein
MGATNQKKGRAVALANGIWRFGSERPIIHYR